MRRTHGGVVLEGSKSVVIKLGSESLEVSGVVDVLGLAPEAVDGAVGFLDGKVTLGGLQDNNVLVRDDLGVAGAEDRGGLLPAAKGGGPGESQGEDSEEQRELHFQGGVSGQATKAGFRASTVDCCLGAESGGT